MELRKELTILNLSIKEERVLLALLDGFHTVLDIARNAKVSRPTVYHILKTLKKRELVVSKVHNGKKGWYMTPERDLSETLYSLKKKLLFLLHHLLYGL